MDDGLVTRTSFRSARLDYANLENSRFQHCDFRSSNLYQANLAKADLLDCNFTDADLSGCKVFGVSTWRLELTRAKQQDILITDRSDPQITVDNVEVAQFIYRLLKNNKLREIIDTITSKVVLILGRFTPDRKQLIDAPRNDLRSLNYLPVVFDFDKPSTATQSRPFRSSRIWRGL
jgi:Pentapeptide repeats (9 copies)